MKVINEYPNSHHYLTRYEKYDMYCPKCGSKSVWEEIGSGDYYEGNNHICTVCKIIFTMPSIREVVYPNEFGVVEQLVSGITKNPTTPRGR